MRQLRVLVANVGTHPELVHIAAGLVKSGHSVTYLTGSMLQKKSLLRRLLLVAVPAKFHHIIDVRTLPQVLDKARVRTYGLPWEALFLLSMRVGSRFTRPIEISRNVYFCKRAATVVWRRERYDVVVTQQTNASAVFEKAARGEFKVLNYPIAHHRWMKSMSAHEASTNPDWAEFLQGAKTPDQELIVMDSEVDLADLILVAGSFVQRSFVEAGVKNIERVQSILLASAAEPRQSRSLTHTGRQGLRVLFAGQVNQRKGIGYLMDALGQIHMDDFNVRVVGPVAQDMRDRLAGLNYGLEVRGAVSKLEMYESMGWADVLVLPSLAEGFALTPIEAMSLGCCVIVSSNTGVADIIDHKVNGLLVDAGSAVEIAKSLEWCNNNRDMVFKLGQRAVRTALEYTWERYEREVVTSIVDRLALVEQCGPSRA